MVGWLGFGDANTPIRLIRTANGTPTLTYIVVVVVVVTGMPTQLTTQERLFGEQDAEYGTLTVENAVFYPFVRVLRSFVKEARFEATGDGLRSAVVNPANVGVIDATLRCDHDIEPGTTVGVNVKKLAGLLQNKPRDLPLDFDLAMPYGMLRVEREYANGAVWDIRERVTFLDPESIRGKETVNVEFDTTVTVDLKPLREFVTSRDPGAPVELSVRDGELHVGKIVNNSEDVGAYGSVAVTSVDTDAESTALYSPGYLTDLLKGIDSTGAETVTLSWSDEYPLRAESQTDAIDTEWYVAPRIAA